MAEGHTFRLHADAAGRRSLAGGEAVDLVVHDDVEQVHVAAHGVNEMVAADPEAVSVAARHHHGDLVIGELQTSGYRQRPTVQGVHAIGIRVAGEVGGATDAADGYHFMVRYLQLDQRLLDGRKHAEITASSAPVGIDFAYQIH